MRTVFFIIVSFSIIYSFDKNYESYSHFLKRYVCNGGVSYGAIDKKELKVIAAELSSLSHNAYQNMRNNDKIAYLINLYNFYTIYLIAEHYPLKEGIKEIAKPWDKKFIILFNKKKSLNYIEHTILRKEFDEPRIHFALVCASKGCPEIINEAFGGTNLENQLDNTAKNFLNDKKKNHTKGNTLYVSKIFEWYGKDFNSKYGSFEKYIHAVLGLKGTYKISFLNYDWNLNEVTPCN